MTKIAIEKKKKKKKKKPIYPINTNFFAYFLYKA